MSTLLQIDSSPLVTSISRELTGAFVAAWKQAHPAGTVIHRDLAAHPPKPLDAGWVHASFTPETSRSSEQKQALAESDALLAELERADTLVVGVAMHNFSVPSVLKLWIDQVVRAGRTFTYGENGPKGLLQGKKLTLITASGGNYAQGTPAGALNFVEPYLRTVFGFIGISDISIVTAGGVSQIMSGAVDRETFLKPALDQVRRIAA